MPRTKRKKAIFVDGASLSFMRRPMGIGLLNHDKFYRVLVNEVGKVKELLTPPLITVTPNMANPEGFKKTVKTAGFEPVIKDPSTSEDDQFVIDKISGLDPKVVSEIVIVASDRDYVPCLREKAAQGIKIYWVAVRANGENGRRMLSTQLENIFQSGEFEFVDLSQWKDELRMKPWVERPRRDPNEGKSSQPSIQSPGPLTESKTIKVTMEVVVVGADRAFAVQHSIGSLMGNVSKLEGIIKTKTTTEVE